MDKGHSKGGPAIVWGEKGTQILTAARARLPFEHVGCYTGHRYVWTAHRYILPVDKRDLPGVVDLPGSAEIFREIRAFREQQAVRRAATPLPSVRRPRVKISPQHAPPAGAQEES